MFRKRLMLCFIMLLSVLFYFSMYLKVELTADAAYYANMQDTRWCEIGENLYRYGAYATRYDSSGKILHRTFRATPVYPLLFRGAFSVFGLNDAAFQSMRLLMVLCLLGLVFISYKMGALFSYRTGCLAAFLALLDLNLLSWALNCWVPDMLIAFFFMLSAYFMLSFIKKGASRRDILLSSFFLALASLTKPTTFLFWLPALLFLVVYVLISWRIKLVKIKKASLCIFIFLAVQGLLLGGWSFRNYMLFGAFEFSSQKGEALLFWTNAHLMSYREGISFAEAKERLYKEYYRPYLHLDESARNKKWTEIAVAKIKGSAIDFAIVNIKGQLRLFCADSWPRYIFEDRVCAGNLGTHFRNGNYAHILLWIFYRSVKYLTLLSAAGGAVYILIRGPAPYRWMLLFSLLVLAYCMAVLSPASHVRYRSLFMPLIYCFAAYGLMNFFFFCRDKCRRLFPAPQDAPSEHS